MIVTHDQQKRLHNLSGKYIKRALYLLEEDGYQLQTKTGRLLRKRIVDAINELSREMEEILEINTEYDKTNQ